MVAAAAALPPPAQSALEHDLKSLIGKLDRSMVVRGRPLLDAGRGP